MMQAESATTSSTRREITVIVNPVASIVLAVLLTIVVKLLIERPSLYPTERWRQTIATIAVTGIGAGLFWLKKRLQIVYGASEVLLGVVGIWASFGKLQKTPDPPTWVALVASAYLIVRGLTNCEEAATKPLPDLIESWFAYVRTLICRAWSNFLSSVLSVLCKIKTTSLPKS